MQKELILNKLNKHKYTIIAFAIILLDQIAKILVKKYISPTETLHIIPYLFDFVYVENTGAAFSILSNMTPLLGIVSILFCGGVVVYWYKKKPSHILLKLTAVLLFAGAFGNAIDRIIRGYVIDFISTAFMQFPVFNVADIAITAGAALLVIYLLFFDEQKKAEE